MGQGNGNVRIREIANNGKRADSYETSAHPGAHILMIPHPALPHITPFVHLAELLVSQGGIQCTVVSHEHLLQKVVKDELSDGIHMLGLPMVAEDVDSSVKDFDVLTHSQELHLTVKKYVEKLLQEKASGLEGPTYTCLISDLVQDWSADLASKLGAIRYLFSPMSAFFNLLLSSYKLFTETGAEAESSRAKSWLGDSSMPGLKLEHGVPWKLSRNLVYETMFDSRSRAEGILLNTFYEFESRGIEYLHDMGWNVIPVGPVQSGVQVSKVPLDDSKYVDDECLPWLDKQPAKSVVYVNFGTTGFNLFTLKMVHELALGLEASQVRFLWILRPPPALKSDELDQLLPTGFEERVKDRGLILRGWGPQLKILEHPSTATFLMQCGWNSMLEAAVRGIPFIGWATYADQPYNGLYTAEITKTGILLPHKTKEVDRYDVETAVRTMMFSEEGQNIMRKAEEMKQAAINAVKPGGSSHNGILDFVECLKRGS